MPVFGAPQEVCIRLCVAHRPVLMPMAMAMRRTVRERVKAYFAAMAFTRAERREILRDTVLR